MPSWLRPLSLIAAALGVAGLAGWLAARLHLPLPWMLGPLFSVALLRVAGVPLQAPGGGRQAGQWAIGTALGLYFTPAVLAELGRHTGAIVPIPFASLLLAASPGSMAEMSITAREMHLSVPLVTATHVLRVVLLTACAPLLFRTWQAWRRGPPAA